MSNIPCVVSIAGSDPSGGAGIQADIKTISATGCYAASVITVLTAQNTQGVFGIYPISPDFVRQQIDAVFTDLTINAVKIGVLYNQAIMEVILLSLQKYNFKNIILDPVMIAKDGSLLLQIADLEFLKNKLFSKVNLITPNIPEAEFILADKINNFIDMEKAVKQLAKQYQVSVLLKGGHLDAPNSSDVLYDFKNKKLIWFNSERIITKNTHGTGCTLSSAIASYLAQDYDLIEAVKLAKEYLTKAITAGSKVSIGLGKGPVDHFYLR